MKIVDASVALKWFVNEPIGQEAADEVLKEIENHPNFFAVPELFFAEMIHVLCRVFRNKSKVQESLTILETLGLERIGLGHELLQAAAEISLAYKVSGYDAIYIATAQLVNGQWHTFDIEAHRKIAPLKLSRVLQ
ncbi:MAG: hypothetical protein C5B49_14265 [Bdellovibrio sp.]|nr:MAG: hypothetical protein C5B49_14265 [Bdellovibrio sp.]